MLTPVTTVPLLLLQMLHDDTAYSHLPPLASLRFSAAAYCQAHARLPLHFFDLLLARFGSECRPVLRTKAGGLAIARVWSMARNAPCPIPLS